jgi:hypothetical protein
LQLSSIGIDLPKLLLIAGPVEQDTPIEIFAERRTHSRRVGLRQQVGSEVFCADRVGLCLLIILALIVAAYGHRKAESDDEAEQCQRQFLKITLSAFMLLGEFGKKSFKIGAR